MAPPSPPSASDSQNSETLSLSNPQVDAAPNNEVPEKPDPSFDPYSVLDSAEYLKKYKKYEVGCVRRLQAKYFSKNNISGGNIFDEKTPVDGETIKSSRWHCTRSYADPVMVFEDQKGSGPRFTFQS